MCPGSSRALSTAYPPPLLPCGPATAWTDVAAHSQPAQCVRSSVPWTTRTASVSTVTVRRPSGWGGSLGGVVHASSTATVPQVRRRGGRRVGNPVRSARPERRKPPRCLFQYIECPMPPAVWIPAAACRATAIPGPVGTAVAAPAGRWGAHLGGDALRSGHSTASTRVVCTSPARSGRSGNRGGVALFLAPRVECAPSPPPSGMTLPCLGFGSKES